MRVVRSEEATRLSGDRTGDGDAPGRAAGAHDDPRSAPIRLVDDRADAGAAHATRGAPRRHDEQREPANERAERRLREACELAADAGAVRRGTPPAALASALLRAREETLAPAAARAPDHDAGGDPRPRLYFQLSASP